MLPRLLALAALSLPLAGCVTYEVVETRDGYARYDDRYYVDDRYDRRYDDRYDSRYESRRPYDDVRYVDPYDQWFYGYRGSDPYFYGSVISYRPSVFGHAGWSSSWAWSRGWGYRDPWYGVGYRDPWYGWGYRSPFYGGGYYVPHRPYRPREERPRVSEARPMPKPFVRDVGVPTTGPRIDGPAIGGESVWTSPRPRMSEDGRQRDNRREDMPEQFRSKPRVIVTDDAPRAMPSERIRRMPEPMQRFEPRNEPQPAVRFERPMDRRVERPVDRRPEPRFERQPERRAEPRFEPREEIRAKPAIDDEP